MRLSPLVGEFIIIPLWQRLGANKLEAYRVYCNCIIDKLVFHKQLIKNIKCLNFILTFSGFVNSQSDINTAVKVARSVKGVKSVKDDMQIK